MNLDLGSTFKMALASCFSFSLRCTVFLLRLSVTLVLLQSFCDFTGGGGGFGPTSEVVFPGNAAAAEPAWLPSEPAWLPSEEALGATAPPKAPPEATPSDVPFFGPVPWGMAVTDPESFFTLGEEELPYFLNK